MQNLYCMQSQEVCPSCCATKTLQRWWKNKKREVPEPFLTADSAAAAKLIVGLPHAVKELTS